MCKALRGVLVLLLVWAVVQIKASVEVDVASRAKILAALYQAPISPLSDLLMFVLFRNRERLYLRKPERLTVTRLCMKARFW